MTIRRKRVPVILDTDIGGDIDDTWAVAMMLNSSELDVKLITTDTANTTYRAQLVAKLLEVAGRADIPVGVGIRQETPPCERQADWVADYPLARFPGKVYADGVDALIHAILDAPEPVTLICIGPVPNIAAALEREPGIAPRADFVGMHGSIRRQHGGKPGAIAEYNVATDIKACQKVFAAPWRSMRITPLDTCGIVRLDGARYQRVLKSAAPLTRAVIENYRVWARTRSNDLSTPDVASSILFDTVAIHLAFSTAFLAMEKMRIRVTDEGFTVPDAGAREMDVALDWTDLEGYQDYLVGRMLGEK